jgi:hypothetical protein
MEKELTKEEIQQLPHEEFMMHSRKSITELEKKGIKFKGSYYSPSRNEHKIIITKNSYVYRYIPQEDLYGLTDFGSIDFIDQFIK